MSERLEAVLGQKVIEEDVYQLLIRNICLFIEQRFKVAPAIP